MFQLLSISQLSYVSSKAPCCFLVILYCASLTNMHFSLTICTLYKFNLHFPFSSVRASNFYVPCSSELCALCARLSQIWVLYEIMPNLTLLTVFSNICAALSSRLSIPCTAVSQPQPDEWLRLRRDCKILSLLSNTSMQIVRPLLQVTQMHVRNSVSLFFSIALPPSLLTFSPILLLNLVLPVMLKQHACTCMVRY